MEQSHFLSENTQATLLLCAPLVAARVKDVSPLSLGEFNDLLGTLERNGASLCDLLEAQKADPILESLHPQFDTARLSALLARGFALSLSVEKWSSYGFWIASREDERYPRRLTERLKHLAPALIYGCGDPALLAAGGVAIVGSRDVDDTATIFTQKLGAACAREGMTVISGGARGVDQLSMLAAVDAGGKVVGVLADSMARSATSANARDALQDGRVTLISPFDPEAGFNVGNAMSRNKAIYALADYGVVVSSGLNEGGTWSGAIEELDKYKFVPIFVRDGAEIPEGNKRLLKQGALPLAPPPWPGSLKEEFDRLVSEAKGSPSRNSLVQPSLL